MPRRTLTARFVDTVSVETRTDIWDDVVRGLVLRVAPTGVKSWTVVYTRTSDGAKRRLTIGKFPAIDLHAARSKALAALTSISGGDDPAAKKRARREGMTVRELAGLYIEKYAKRNKRTWAEDQRLLNVEVIPALGSTKVLEVRKRDLLDLIEAKADAGYLAQSTQLLAVVRKMFNWAVESDYLETSPAAGVKPRAKPSKRDRVLTDEEIRRIWDQVAVADVHPATRSILQLLFLTGQRSGEVCGIRLSEVDLERSVWTIPGDRTKNGLVHVVPLAPQALAIIQDAAAQTEPDRSAPLFSRTGEPVESNAVSKAVRLKFQWGLDQWTPHDIRRTFATRVAALGVSPHVVEAMLNHVSGFRAGVAGIYNRHQYDEEKRAAFENWERRLNHLIAGARQ